MTTMSFVADVHMANHQRFGGRMVDGLNDRYRAGLAVLFRAIQASVGEHFCVLGDLFDRDKPSPPELAAVMQIMRDSPKHFHLLLGNHERSSGGADDHALAPLGKLENVTVYTLPAVVNDHFAMIPFQPGPAGEWLPEVVDQLLATAPNARVLCLHLGIADDSTPPYLRGAADSIHVDQLAQIMRKHDLTHVFAGNWHFAQTWSIYDAAGGVLRRIEQLGALVPTGFDNLGEVPYGHVINYTTRGEPGEAVERIRLVGGPCFLRGVYEDHTEGLEELLPEKAARVYLRLQCRPGQRKAALAELGRLRSEGRLTDFEVFPDREAVSASAKVAARSASSATTVEQAVAEYVAKAQFGEGVDRSQVLSLVQRFLSR